MPDERQSEELNDVSRRRKDFVFGIFGRILFGDFLKGNGGLSLVVGRNGFGCVDPALVFADEIDEA